MKVLCVILSVALLPVAIAFAVGMDQLADLFQGIASLRAFALSYLLAVVLVAVPSTLPRGALQWLIERGGAVLSALTLALLAFMLIAAFAFERYGHSKLGMVLSILSFSAALGIFSQRMLPLGLNDVQFPKIPASVVFASTGGIVVALQESGIADFTRRRRGGLTLAELGWALLIIGGVMMLFQLPGLVRRRLR